jgi:hypothetical protein
MGGGGEGGCGFRREMVGRPWDGYLMDGEIRKTWQLDLRRQGRNSKGRQDGVSMGH